MPRTIYERIGVGELKPTRMTLQLADSSVRLPLGIVEDLPVQVGKYFVPVDFVVMEMEEDKEVPIILGRPFLRTAGAIIDVRQGTLTLNFGGEKVKFQIERAMKYPSQSETCFRVDGIEELLADLAEDYFLDQVNNSLRHHSEFLSQLPSEASESICAADVIPEDLEDLRCKLDGSHEDRTTHPETSGGAELDKADVLTLHESDHPDTACVNDQPKRPTPELKPLPANLRYEFLDPDKACPVIVNASLNPDQTARLLEKLKLHKGAIGYSIKDLKGINPATCSHRILLEDDHKPSVEH
ncbi:uncharacterized protein LOC144562936 [Carex rostrata]